MTAAGDRDELEWRDAVIDWLEQTHREVRLIRQMVGVFFVLWLLGLAAGAVAIAARS